MTKTHIVLEIVVLLQGTPLDDFARQNFVIEGGRARNTSYRRGL